MTTRAQQSSDDVLGSVRGATAGALCADRRRRQRQLGFRSLNAACTVVDRSCCTRAGRSGARWTLGAHPRLKPTQPTRNHALGGGIVMGIVHVLCVCVCERERERERERQRGPGAF